MEDVALATGLSLEQVTWYAKFRATKDGPRMSRKQSQAYWLRMTREAMDAGEKPGLQLDLSILIFADDAIMDLGGRPYRRNNRRFWKWFPGRYVIDKTVDGTSVYPKGG